LEAPLLLLELLAFSSALHASLLLGAHLLFLIFLYYWPPCFADAPNVVGVPVVSFFLAVFFPLLLLELVMLVTHVLLLALELLETALLLLAFVLLLASRLLLVFVLQYVL
jgi:hypothetical protein